MLLYAVAAAAIMFGMVGAASWLVAPDPTGATQARASPVLPRRIAESIERKSAPLPDLPKETSVMRPVSQPVMKVAPVALSPATPKFRGRELPAAPVKKAGRKPRNEPVSAPQDGPAPPLPTARTDFPY